MVRKVSERERRLTEEWQNDPTSGYTDHHYFRQLDQIRSEEGDSDDGGPCFVATSVYNDSFAPQVEFYRWLNNNHIKGTRLGDQFNDWYYSGGGERLSKIVEEHPFLRIPSRMVLDFGVRIGRYFKEK